jgi:hypothetical protein
VFREGDSTAIFTNVIYKGSFNTTGQGPTKNMDLLLGDRAIGVIRSVSFRP